MMRKSVGNGLELMRMTIYVFFPVAVFYYFNLPEYFDKFVASKRKLIHPEGNHPPLSVEENEKMRLLIKEEKRKQRMEQSSSGGGGGGGQSSSSL